MQGFVNFNNAGNSFSRRTGQLIIDNSKTYGLQTQSMLDFWDSKQHFTFGFDAKFIRPNTEGTINGDNEENDNINELGAYLESDTKISESFDFIAAARIDKHSELENAIFLPHAALIYKPTPLQSFRITLNTAFNTP